MVILYHPFNSMLHPHPDTFRKFQGWVKNTSCCKQHYYCMHSLESFSCSFDWNCIKYIIKGLIGNKSTIGFTFLNILYFFKYSCTNIFHRRSLYTFYWFREGLGITRQQTIASQKFECLHCILVALEVVIVRTSGAASDDNVIKEIWVFLNECLSDDGWVYICQRGMLDPSGDGGIPWRLPQIWKLFIKSGVD